MAASDRHCQQHQEALELAVSSAVATFFDVINKTDENLSGMKYVSTSYL